MIKYFAGICLFFCSLSLQAQSDAKLPDPLPVAALQVQPEYPGGIKEFYKFVYSKFRVPDVDIEGTKVFRVYVSFVVEKDGSLSEIKVVRDPGYGLGEETKRMLALSQKWSPGVQDGKAVRTSYMLPVSVNITGYTPEKPAEQPVEKKD